MACYIILWVEAPIGPVRHGLGGLAVTWRLYDIVAVVAVVVVAVVAFVAVVVITVAVAFVAVVVW